MVSGVLPTVGSSHIYVTVNNLCQSMAIFPPSLPYRLVFPKDQFLGLCYFLIYISDLPNSSQFLSFFLFADDTNIHKLAKKVNTELKYVN